MRISTIRINNFKRIKNIELHLNSVTVLIGGNNSGKSSLLQGIHLAITTLQSARSASPEKKPVSTLGFDQLIFKPASDPMKLNHQADMSSSIGPEFTFVYSTDETDDESSFDLKMRRGKNANISVRFAHDNPFYERASDRTRPLSIFVPVLARLIHRFWFEDRPAPRRSRSALTVSIS